MTWGAHGRSTRQKPASGSIRCPRPSIRPSAKPQVKAKKAPLTIKRPSGIRTCAHDSGESANLSL